MFPAARLKFLQQRKQELLNAGEVQRRLWAMECANVQQRLGWLDRTITTARRILPWCGLALPLLRLWSSRREGAGKSWLGTIAGALPIARRVVDVWKAFSQRRDGSRPVFSEDEQTAPNSAKQTTV